MIMIIKKVKERLCNPEQENERQTEEQEETERDSRAGVWWGRESGLQTERSSSEEAAERGKDECGKEEDRRHRSLLGVTGEASEGGGCKGEGRDGKGRWEPLRAGTMPCMPQHPQGVPCSGPGVQEVLRRRLLTLNASRSQGALPVPPATLLSGPCVLMVAKVTCGAAPEVPSAPLPAPLAAAPGAGPAPCSSGAYV